MQVVVEYLILTGIVGVFGLAATWTIWLPPMVEPIERFWAAGPIGGLWRLFWNSLYFAAFVLAAFFAGMATGPDRAKQVWKER